MSYSDSFPTQTPVLNLIFATGSDQFLDSRISFSRADTPPTYSAPSGVHYWSNEKHLSSENLLLQSQDFDTSWSGIHLASSVSGGHSGPDGSSTGWLMTANTGTSQEPQLQQLFAVNSNTEYTAIAHLKAGTASHGYISFRGGSGGHYAYASIDFSAGTVADGGSGFTGISSSITALSDSWYKVIVTATSDSTTSSPYCFIGISDGSAFGSNGTAPYDSNGETMYAWGVQLSSTNSKVYDSPTTTQISREYSSTLKSVTNAGDPRFEYDPTDGQSVGLLIESQVSNLLTYSEDFSNAAWTKTNTLVSSNSGIAPTGELTADLVTAVSTGANTSNTVNRAFSFTSGNTYTFSFFAKAAGYSKVRFYPSNGTTLAASATFDLSGNGATSSVTGTAKIEHVGNGYYRCSVSGASGQTAATNINIALADAGGSTSFDGDDYSGVLLFGASLEQSSSMSSYIKTTSSTVSRAADSCSVALSETNYSGGEGSLVVDLSINARSGGWGVSIGTDNNDYYMVGQFATTTEYLIYSELNNSAQAAIYQSMTSIGPRKIAGSWATNDVSACIDGGAVTTDTSNAIPNMSKIMIGQNFTETNISVLNGHFKRISLYSVALSDVELQSLTS